MNYNAEVEKHRWCVSSEKNSNIDAALILLAIK